MANVVYSGKKVITSGGGNTSSDPFSSNILTYLKGEGADNSTAILDSAPSPSVITAKNGARIKTNQKKLGNSSLFLPGGTGVIEIEKTVTLSSAFTLEKLIYTSSQSGSIISGRNTGDLDIFFGLGYIYFSRIFTAFDCIIPYSIPLNQWFHFAVCRTAQGLLGFFIDGELIYSTSNGISYKLSSPYVLGNWWNGSDYVRGFTGYLDNFRLTPENRYFRFDPNSYTFY